MNIPGTIPKPVSSIDWQDYRSYEKAMVVYYNTDPVSEIPIREVPEEFPSDIAADPNYESGTYGLYGCSKPKIRRSFFKSKLKYLFFMTKYAGTNVEYMDQLIATGYFRICQNADVKKLHIRYLKEYACLNEDVCMAFRADEKRFVSLQDAFVLTPEVLQDWGVSKRVTRQTRIILNQQATKLLLEHFRSKEDKTEEYISETKRLSPDMQEEEEEEEEEGGQNIEEAVGQSAYREKNDEQNS